MRWPWSKGTGQPSALTSISDPALMRLFNPFADGQSIDGITLGEFNALTVPGLYRACSLISGTLGSLPMPSYRMDGDTREVVASVFDDPDGPDGATPYEWKETAFLHLLLHGRAGALKVRTEAGGLAGLALVHPYAFEVRQPTPDEIRSGPMPKGRVWFRVNLADGTTREFDAEDFWYVPGPSLCGYEGMGLLQYARLTLSTAVAGSRSAGNMFARGAMMAGFATPDDDVDIHDELPAIRRELNSVSGTDNAGTIAVINRRLKITPWTMTNVDAQFLQSREFGIEEIARFTGVPPHLLMSSEKSTSWGTGLEEQNRALARTVLAPWANRFEQRASRLLARPRWCEFDFAALERPAPDREIELDLQQVAAGVMTVDEYRTKRGWAPLPDPVAPAPASGGGAGDPAAQ